MRIVLAAVAFALLVPATLSGARSPYTDSSCRTDRVAWTNDACAAHLWGLTAIKAPQAWRTTRGAGLTVAVVDTGADFRHPDLRGRLIRRPGANLLSNTAFRCPFQRPEPGARHSRAVAQDDNGHGTHVAGIIAATAGNGIGVAGVAPAAHVLPVKVLDRSGMGSDRDVARGICYAAQQGAKVINLSLGNDPVSSIFVSGKEGADTNRAVLYAYRRGAAVIIAAGNDSFPACDFPASHAKALCVGAVDRRGIKATYSNFGVAIGVVAPGGSGTPLCNGDEDIWSTILPARTQDCGRDGYEPLAGASMATPHVSAVAALVISRFGRRMATPKFVYDRLKRTADDAGIPGVDPFYGYGRVNAQRAVG